MNAKVEVADHAELINGKIYALGLHWSVTGPEPLTCSVYATLEYAEHEPRKHNVRLMLVESDGTPAMLITPEGPTTVEIGAEVEGSRIPGLPDDVPNTVFVGPLNVNGLPLAPGRAYCWRLSVDGRTSTEWDKWFYVRPAAVPAFS